MKIKKIELAEIFISDIRNIILSARDTAIRNVDAIRVQMYWKLGERIFIEEQKGQDRAEYGATGLAANWSGRSILDYMNVCC